MFQHKFKVERTRLYSAAQLVKLLYSIYCKGSDYDSYYYYFWTWTIESGDIQDIMYIFGLTGGIGSGKSTVSRHLQGLGCPVIDADIIARQGNF